MEIEWTKHAEFELSRRGIDRKLAKEIAQNPEQEILEGSQIICQGRYFDKDLGKEMLLRVVIEKTKVIRIITLYKTSQIKRYWL